jgi:hypothetical protein
MDRPGFWAGSQTKVHLVTPREQKDTPIPKVALLRRFSRKIPEKC